MKQKRKLNKKSIRLLILILGLIVLVVSTSYAVFSIRHENTNNQIVSAGELELTYNSCSTMTTEMVPMSNEDGMAQAGCNVTVENTGSLDAIYKVLIYNNSSGSNHLSHDNLYVSIDNSTPVLLSTITKLEDTEKYNLKEDILLVGNTRNHNIKIWIKEDATTDIVGKSVNLIVDIEAVVLEEIPESYEYAYTGTVQEFTVPATGYYDVELWGASGGIGNGRINGPGGRGGYSSGSIYLEKDEMIYIYVGQKGADSIYGNNISIASSFNGGGAGGNAPITIASRPTVTGGSGGGATDVRLVKASSTDDTIWNESASLRSRIIVAGGGGGTFDTENYNITTTLHTGNNLGLFGDSGMVSTTHPNVGGAGATQISGNAFGYGATGSTGHTWNDTNAGGMIGCGGVGGGGGGYYGGEGALTSGGYCYSNGGGAGSSYISGYAGVNSVQESDGTAAQPLHTNNTLHYSGKYFIHGSMEAGVNSGNGKAKITYIGSAPPERTNTNLDNVRYMKSCQNGSDFNLNSLWTEVQAIKNGNNIVKGKNITSTVAPLASTPLSFINDGNISYLDGYTVIEGLVCITIDLGIIENLDEIVLWTYYGDERMMKNNVLSVSGDNNNWVELHNFSDGYPETGQGKRYTAWD